MAKQALIFTAQQALGSGALTHDVVIGAGTEVTSTPASNEEYEIEFAAIAAASAITQTAILSIISVSGAAWTFAVSTLSLSAATSGVHLNAHGIRVRRGDTVRLTCTNTATPAITVSSELRLVPIG